MPLTNKQDVLKTIVLIESVFKPNFERYSKFRALEENLIPLQTILRESEQVVEAKGRLINEEIL